MFRIRIRMDSHSFGSPGSGFKAFQNDLCTYVGTGMFYGILRTLSTYRYPGTLYRTFHVKIRLFVTAKSDQDPDPHEFAVVWLPVCGSTSGSALRSKIGSGYRFALKLVRIRTTA
jgi:hypothetical protein